MASGIKARMMRGTMWIAGARVLVNGIAFASTILLARLLTPTDFGIVAIATAITTIVQSITELSLAEALVQHEDPSEEHFHSAWTLNVARSSLLGLIIAIAAWPISLGYDDPRLLPIMLVIAAVTALNGASNPKLIVFQRNLIFWQDFAFSVSQKVAGFVVAIGVAIIFRSYWALVAGMIATQVCAIALSYALYPYRPRLRFVETRELLSFSVWLTLSRAVNALNYRSDQLLIGYVLGPKLLGYYTVGDNLAALPTREAIAPLTQTLFPAFARLSQDVGRLRDAYRRAHALLCAIAFPVGIGFAVVAQPLVLLLMGGKWLPSVPIIQVITVVIALSVLTMPLQALAMAAGETKVLFGRDVRNLLIRVPFMLLGLWIGSQTILGAVMGIIWGRAVSNVIGNIWNMLLVRRIIGLGVGEQLIAVWRTGVGSAVMVVAATAAQALIPDGGSSGLLIARVVVAVAAGALAYAATLAGLWVAQGRPGGAETEIITLAGQALKKFRPAAGV